MGSIRSTVIKMSIQKCQELSSCFRWYLHQSACVDNASLRIGVVVRGLRGLVGVLTSQHRRPQNCHSERMIDRDGDFWILIELLFLSFSQSFPLRGFSHTRIPVGILSITNKCKISRSDCVPDPFPLMSGWKWYFARWVLDIIPEGSFRSCAFFEKESPFF